MGGQVINLGAVTQEAPSRRAEAGRAKPALDGSRFRDQGRFQSSEVMRGFASVIHADSLRPECDVSAPHEAMVEPGVDVQIVRGVD